MRAIERLVAHYKANKSQSIMIRLGDGEPLAIFWDLMTLERRDELFAMPGRRDVDVVIAMAKDAEGKALFDVADKPLLMLSTDAFLIKALAEKMLGADRSLDDLVKAAEKN